MIRENIFRLFSILILFVSFNFSYGQKKDSFIDKRDGIKYKTVKIGKQIWMAENLAFKTKRGCWAYEKNVNNINEFGYLYNWKTANKICPNNWHLPSEKEFKILIENLGGTDSLKYISITDTASFDVKFSGWYAGRRYGQLGEHTDFWSSTKYNLGAYRLSVYKIDEIVYMHPDYTNYGFSVRCIKD